MLKWGRLAVLRSWVLSLAGFGSLTLGAFLWHVVVGFVVLGVCCLIIEALTRPPETEGTG